MNWLGFLAAITVAILGLFGGQFAQESLATCPADSQFLQAKAGKVREWTDLVNGSDNCHFTIKNTEKGLGDDGPNLRVQYTKIWLFFFTTTHEIVILHKSSATIHAKSVKLQTMSGNDDARAQPLWKRDG